MIISLLQGSDNVPPPDVPDVGDLRDNVFAETGEDAGEDAGEARLVPPRVLVFTTLPLLALLSLVSDAFVDGTFKTISKQWAQLFIMIADVRGSPIPLAMGFLPGLNIYYLLLRGLQLINIICRQEDHVILSVPLPSTQSFPTIQRGN